MSSHANTARIEPATAAGRPIQVMVVDDSAVVRGLLTRILEADPQIEICQSVGDGARAVEKQRTDPAEVIVLDIEMPHMDGLTALPKLLEIDPTVQVLMASTLTLRNAEISLKALRLGAADYIPKPTASGDIAGGRDFKQDLVEKVRALGLARRRATGAPARTPAALPAAKTAPAGPAAARAEDAPIALRAPSKSRPRVLAIGSSTGGPQALFAVLGALANKIHLPVLITQHMPATFTAILAQHVGQSTGWPAAEAADGDTIEPGRVYIAPGDYHMIARREGTATKLCLTQDPPENFCRPAVDPMLRSLADIYGADVMTVILTGMGHDGQKGCEYVVQKGGTVVAQDEATSVVWGMPGAVATGGLCSAVLPLDGLAPWIAEHAGGARP